MMCAAMICGVMIVGCGGSGGGKSETKSEELSKTRDWAKIFGNPEKSKNPELNFYKNLFTGEILDSVEFERIAFDLLHPLGLWDTIYISSLDSTEPQMTLKLSSKVDFRLHFFDRTVNNDSVISHFKYSIRIGDEYIVRPHSYEKIGMYISPQILKTIDGNNIQIGGKQDKPIFVNLWFPNCPPCIEEIPALNRLQEKYADKVDFVAITFDNVESRTSRIIKEKKFNFKHIIDAEDFIKQIGSKPYPENIFIDSDGHIRYIEGGLHDDKISGLMDKSDANFC